MERPRTDTDIFKEFIGREQDLRAIPRYNMYDVMVYRTNLFTHSHRTATIVRALSPLAKQVFGSSYDSRRAEILGYVHDDAEIIFGDIQAGNKSKMTDAQLQEVSDAERAGIYDIAARFPRKVGGYLYIDLLADAMDHSSLESQVVSYADKYDAMGEALHEVYAGNPHFTMNVVNEYGRIPTPPEYYHGYFGAFLDKFPEMQPLLELPFPMFEPVALLDYPKIINGRQLHTQENIHLSVGDHHYDTWKQIILADSIDEVARDLYVPKESLFLSRR